MGGGFFLVAQALAGRPARLRAQSSVCL